MNHLFLIVEKGEYFTTVSSLLVPVTHVLRNKQLTVIINIVREHIKVHVKL